jgi:hypothetical protein
VPEQSGVVNKKLQRTGVPLRLKVIKLLIDGIQRVTVVYGSLKPIAVLVSEP